MYILWRDSSGPSFLINIKEVVLINSIVLVKSTAGYNPKLDLSRQWKEDTDVKGLTEMGCIRCLAQKDDFVVSIELNGPTANIRSIPIED